MKTGRATSVGQIRWGSGHHPAGWLRDARAHSEMRALREKLSARLPWHRVLQAGLQPEPCATGHGRPDAREPAQELQRPDDDSWHSCHAQPTERTDVPARPGSHEPPAQTLKGPVPRRLRRM